MDNRMITWNIIFSFLTIKDGVQIILAQFDHGSTVMASAEMEDRMSEDRSPLTFISRRTANGKREAVIPNSL